MPESTGVIVFEDVAISLAGRIESNALIIGQHRGNFGKEEFTMAGLGLYSAVYTTFHHHRFLNQVLITYHDPDRSSPETHLTPRAPATWLSPMGNLVYRSVERTYIPK